jgi:hypothetical protein
MFASFALTSFLFFSKKLKNEMYGMKAIRPPKATIDEAAHLLWEQKFSSDPVECYLGESEREDDFRRF